MSEPKKKPFKIFYSWQSDLPDQVNAQFIRSVLGEVASEPNGLGCEVLSGLIIALGELAAEREDYKQIFLLGRLRTKPPYVSHFQDFKT